MVDLRDKCSDGWDPSELLAFLEGDLPPESRTELEQHLSLCRACSSELESLRGLDGMLKACPQCFHPDEEDLYRFVSSAEDPEGRVSAHVETCKDCKEAVAALREMVAVGSNASTTLLRMPQTLLRSLEARYPAMVTPAERSSRFAWALEWLRRPFGMPMLAVGAVAAVLVVAALLIPFWTQLKDVTQPEGVAPLVKAPTPAAPPPAPRASLPALGKGEPLKLKEDFRGAPVSETARAAAPSVKAYRVPHGSHSENRVGFQAQEPPKGEGATRRFGELQTEPTDKQRPRVAVQIIPPAGQDFPGLRFVPPKEMESKYLFTEKIGAEKERAKEKKHVLDAAVTGPEEEAYTVTVQVRQSGPLYSLEGTISGAGVAKDRKKTVSKPDVAPENLQGAITAMVVSLLQGE